MLPVGSEGDPKETWNRVWELGGGGGVFGNIGGWNWLTGHHQLSEKWVGEQSTGTEAGWDGEGTACNLECDRGGKN